LKPAYTETYRFYVESFKTAEFELKLNGKSLIKNQFDTTNIDPQHMMGAYFNSEDIDLAADKLYEIELNYSERLGM